HIVPGKGAYDSMKLLTGPRRFVLGASGHIAGVINHPSRQRRSYWQHTTAPDLAPNGRVQEAEQWFANTTEYTGSWWPDWAQWLVGQSGNEIVSSDQLGSETFPPIEAAPGRYVRVRAV